MFIHSRLPRPVCFDHPGCTWTKKCRDEALVYLFTENNLNQHRNLARRWTGHDQDAEDATHDYIASGFFDSKTVARFDPSHGTFESWHGSLFVFGRFNFVRAVWCRKRARHGREAILTPEQWEVLINEVESEGIGPADAASQSEALDALQKCLEKLSADELDYLSRFYGCTGSPEERHKEITRTLGISEAAGRKRLSRARRKLRDCLELRGFTSSR